MKRILSVILAFYAASALCATTLPVQLINPVGSTSGQVITSTGASSAPAWSSLPATVTGLTAGTGIAVSSSTGNVTVSIPAGATITTPNITGVTSGSAAAAGSVGEVKTATGTAVSLTNSTVANITSVALTAGDWWCSGNIEYDAAGTTILQTAVLGDQYNLRHASCIAGQECTAGWRGSDVWRRRYNRHSNCADTYSHEWYAYRFPCGLRWLHDQHSHCHRNH